MKTIKIYFILLFVCISILNAEKLNFLKKNNFNLGKGDSLTLDFTFPNYKHYNFKSQTKAPFSLQKTAANKFTIIFNASLLKEDNEKLQNEEEYSERFYFTKKNIGSKKSILVKATYLDPNFEKIDTTQTALSDTTDIIEQTIKSQTKTNTSLKNMAEKVNKTASIITNPQITQKENNTNNNLKQKSSSNLMLHITYIVIIIILIILLIIFIVKSMLLKQNNVSDKYKDFYDDCSTILDVDVKGKSIETSITDIMMKLLEVTQSHDLGDK